MDPNVSAKCLDAWPTPATPTEQYIATGTYQPLPYLLPAAVARLPLGPVGVSRLMRLAKALICVGLLALAIALLRAPPLGSLAYAGLVVALTPMTLFLMASLNPSGVEIIASVAFISSLLRLARDAPEPARWIWAAMGVSGFVLALSRTPAPSWIVISAALFLLLVGIRGPGTSSAAICPRRPRRCSPSRSACC